MPATAHATWSSSLYLGHLCVSRFVEELNQACLQQIHQLLLNPVWSGPHTSFLALRPPRLCPAAAQGAELFRYARSYAAHEETLVKA